MQFDLDENPANNSKHENHHFLANDPDLYTMERVNSKSSSAKQVLLTCGSPNDDDSRDSLVHDFSPRNSNEVEHHLTTRSSYKYSKFDTTKVFTRKKRDCQILLFPLLLLVMFWLCLYSFFVLALTQDFNREQVEVKNW